jgi:hypothetical protein
LKIYGVNYVFFMRKSCIFGFSRGHPLVAAWQGRAVS